MHAPVRNYHWPALPVDECMPTRDTLHMWTQIVGKIRLEYMPLINHWWQVTFYVSPRGLTTGAIPYEDAVSKEGAFYCYAYPEPDGFADYPVEPDAAFYSTGYQQFLLPYEAARTAEDPDHAVARFLRTTYEAAATLGGSDRAALEADPTRLPPQSARRTSFGSAQPRQRRASS
jgi:hypothetical protein